MNGTSGETGMDGTGENPAEHLIPLGGTGWQVWRDVELRSAGFPSAIVEPLADDELLAAATAEDGEGPPSDALAREYDRAVTRMETALRTAAADPMLREAVAWQNPAMLSGCVDKVAARSKAQPARQRRRELKVATYLQRYGLKNETIGFFGPHCWGRWSEDTTGMTIRPGERLLRRRQVYFEHWAVEAVARALAADPRVRVSLKPRRSEADALLGDSGDGTEIGIRRPRGPVRRLTAAEAEVFELCDGATTILEIERSVPGYAARAGESVLTVVDRLSAEDLLVCELPLSTGEFREHGLRGALLAVDDAAAREQALGLLDEVLAAREAVSEAAGDADSVFKAMERLDEVFEQVTGQDPARRAGQAYGGRRVVYEDTLRDTEVALGADLLGQLAAPLGLLLDSARWFVGQVGDGYRRRLTQVYERLRAGSLDGEVPLNAVLNAMTPDLAYSFQDLAPPVAAVVPELQRRWAEILAVPDDVRRHRVSAADLAARVRELFPACEPPWSSAVHQCPDIMITARDPQAIAAGDYEFVLGELHLAINTQDSPAGIAQFPEPERFAAMDAADRRTPRVLPLPALESPAVNSRTYPPVLVGPQDLVWTMHARNTGATGIGTTGTGTTGRVVPGAAMTVHRDGERLVVKSPDTPDLDLLEVLGEYLSGAAMNGFKPLPSAAHRPRVTIDRLVISRESWSIGVSDLAWVRRSDRVERHRAAVRWRDAMGLPQRAFYRVAVETKPIYVDFSSIALVELLAAAVRSAAADDPASRVSFSEMLPDLPGHWLRDGAGAAYASELRLVAIDRARA
ncbi:lantibiotic dehydratase [Kitasatospora sp. NPDC056531]|uniref:lantibiotic dehydratase n=1 Tax=Kitasatospora sp. NPDC056531 TaxID=3345856 RepID=UPI0036A44115